MTDDISDEWLSRMMVVYSHCAGSKAELKGMFDEGKIIQFADFYPPGHGSTNYKKWFTFSEPYPITYKIGYEPYVLVNRRMVPWYDERFRGYGWDKVRPPL